MFPYKTNTTYWTFIKDKDMEDYECESEQQALECAQNWLDGCVLDEGYPPRGYACSEKITLVQFYYCENGGGDEFGRVIVQTMPKEVRFEQENDYV